MHFDDSEESIAESDLEDGELHKMVTSPLYAQKASGKPRCIGRAVEREVSAQLTRAEKSLRSHSSEGQKTLGKPNALFSSQLGNLIRSSVFRNANPSNRSIRRDQTWRSKSFMSSPSTSASVN